MPIDELRGRLARYGYCRQERRAYQRRTTSEHPISHNAESADRLACDAQLMLPGTRADELGHLREQWPERFENFADAARTSAASIQRGQYRLLGYSFDLSDPSGIDWHCDPRSSYRWPRNYHADVPIYELPEGVDVKYIWELSRQQYLVTLARDWAYSGSEPSAHLAHDLLLDWIENNPVFEGVNWTSALEVAVRSLSWIWALALTAQWSGWSESDLRRVRESAIEHAEYLRHHFSFYSSPYNHLIGEASCLYLLACWLERQPEAAVWKKESVTVLREHGPHQFYRDGFCVEQASGYHFFTLGFLTQALIQARRSSDDLSTLDAVLPKAFTAGASLQQPNGLWPPIGDVDSARSIPIDPEDFWDFSGICALGTVVNKTFRLGSIDNQLSGRSGEELYLLLGTNGLMRWDQSPVSSARQTMLLPDAGYVVASGKSRDSEDWLLFDAGPIAHGLHRDSTPSVAHGHADALQVLVCLDGLPILADCGISSYSGDRQWVDHFRSSAAHNTIHVDGCPMAQASGRLAWSHVTEDPQLDAKLSDRLWMMRGRIAANQSVTIERNILAIPGEGIWIADLVSCSQPLSASWYWQIPAGLPLRRSEEDAPGNILWLGEFVFTTISSDPNLSITVEAAEVGHPVAWQSRGYGESSAAERVTYRSHPSTQTLVLTRFARTLRPTAVSIRGNRLSSLDYEFGGQPPATLQDQEEVLWDVQTESGAFTVAAGSERLMQSTDWEPLDGIGNWPVAILRSRAISSGRLTNGASQA